MTTEKRRWGPFLKGLALGIALCVPWMTGVPSFGGGRRFESPDGRLSLLVWVNHAWFTEKPQSIEVSIKRKRDGAVLRSLVLQVPDTDEARRFRARGNTELAEWSLDGRYADVRYYDHWRLRLFVDDDSGN